MGDALKSLEAQYLLLTQNLADILAACQTDDQRTQVRENYVAARRNYWDAINQVFHDDDPRIEQAVTQMHDAQLSLQKMTQDLANISKVINAISTAVKLGTQLAAMAG
jgi:ActR/RegA family two-component response regulator